MNRLLGALLAILGAALTLTAALCLHHVTDSRGVVPFTLSSVIGLCVLAGGIWMYSESE